LFTIHLFMGLSAQAFGQISSSGFSVAHHACHALSASQSALPPADQQSVHDYLFQAASPLGRPG
jgi:hypothetical protein